MASPVPGHLPLNCAVTGDELPFCFALGDLVKLVSGCKHSSESDRETMMRQVFYLRDISKATLRDMNAFRCPSGSCDGQFLWFPFLPQHSAGVLDVPFFDRMISCFKAVRSGENETAYEIATAILEN